MRQRRLSGRRNHRLEARQSGMVLRLWQRDQGTANPTLRQTLIRTPSTVAESAQSSLSAAWPKSTTTTSQAAHPSVQADWSSRAPRLPPFVGALALTHLPQHVWTVAPNIVP